MPLFTTFLQIAEGKTDQSRKVWNQVMGKHPFIGQEMKIGTRASSIKFEDTNPIDIAGSHQAAVYLTATFSELADARNLFLTLQDHQFVKKNKLPTGFYEQGKAWMTVQIP